MCKASTVRRGFPVLGVLEEWRKRQDGFEMQKFLFRGLSRAGLGPGAGFWEGTAGAGFHVEDDGKGMEEGTLGLVAVSREWSVRWSRWTFGSFHSVLTPNSVIVLPQATAELHDLLISSTSTHLCALLGNPPQTSTHTAPSPASQCQQYCGLAGKPGLPAYLTYQPYATLPCSGQHNLF